MITTMPDLSDADVMGMRLANLRLSTPGTDPAELTDWFGAMQAQDLASGKWSLGVRLPGSTEQDIDDALARGKVLRTWPMRGTIHLIHPENARWLLELTGVRALRGLHKRWQVLGLDQATVDEAAEVLAGALREGPLTRSQCLHALSAAGIEVGGGRSYHLLWHTAQIGVTCIGPNEGNEQTFVLLDQWAPKQRSLDRDTALATLATMYFRSHGPTTLSDFQGWSGLTAADARAGIAHAELATATWAGSEVFYVRGDPPEPPRALLLPGFDEFLLGYKNRSLFLAGEHAARIVPGGNGMFRATVVERGRVVGSWQRKVVAKRVRIQIEAFSPLAKTTQAAILKRAQDYGRYLGKDVELSYT
jgi:hypothetical protein